MRTRLFASIVVLFLVATACGDDDTGGSSSAATTTPRTTSSTATSVTTTTTAAATTTTTVPDDTPAIVYLTDWEQGLLARSDLATESCTTATIGLHSGDLVDVGHGFVWATDCLGGQLVRFDLDTLEEVGRIDLGDCAAAILVTDELVWVALRQEGRVLGLNPISGEIRDEFTVPDPPIVAMFAGSYNVITNSGWTQVNGTTTHRQWPFTDTPIVGGASYGDGSVAITAWGGRSPDNYIDIYMWPPIGPPMSYGRIPGEAYKIAGSAKQMVHYFIDRHNEAIYVKHDASITKYSAPHPGAPNGHGFLSGTSFYEVDLARILPGAPIDGTATSFLEQPFVTEHPLGCGADFSPNTSVTVTATDLETQRSRAQDIDTAAFPMVSPAADPVIRTGPAAFISRCGSKTQNGVVTEVSVETSEPGTFTITVDIEIDGERTETTAELMTDDAGALTIADPDPAAWGVDAAPPYTMWFRIAGEQGVGCPVSVLS